MLLEEEQYDLVSTKYYKETYHMPTLLTNGCSITLGAELGETTKTHKSGFEYQHCDTDYRHRERWSTKLADKLDMEPINLARGGGSNWRIWRNTQDYLLENQVDFAVIQMTEPSRFQIPISYDFVDKWHPTEMVTNFFDWASGGIYGSSDYGGQYEEYSHWNWGEQHQLNSFMNDRRDKHIGDTLIDENHYVNMADEITGYFLINDQIHNQFDYLRQILYLHNMFESYNIPHLIVDMMMGLTICTHLKDELEQVTEVPVDIQIDKLNANQLKYHYIIDEYNQSKENDYRVWLEYIKKSGMSTKFNNLYKAVVSSTWFDGHPYANYWNRITRDCPREGMNDMYIGQMSRGHPNENCHSIIAERMFSEIQRRNIL